jgi:hypothetical protein
VPGAREQRKSPTQLREPSGYPARLRWVRRRDDPAQKTGGALFRVGIAEFARRMLLSWGLLARAQSDYATERAKLQAALDIFTALKISAHRDEVEAELAASAR